MSVIELQPVHLTRYQTNTYTLCSIMSRCQDITSNVYHIEPLFQFFYCLLLEFNSYKYKCVFPVLRFNSLYHHTNTGNTVIHILYRLILYKIAYINDYITIDVNICIEYVLLKVLLYIIVDNLYIYICTRLT